MRHAVAEHYHQRLQTDQIIQRLQKAYPDGPGPFQLAPVDQLHIGGIKASQKLLTRLAELRPSNVLDIGSGLGGLQRLANNELDLNIVGLDITHALNHINQQLSALCQTQTQAITGDAHHLPFADARFDAVIFQHSLLNMPDTEQVLNECQRILKPGGYLLLHEVVQGDAHNTMRYPVPWARSAETSHLLDQDALVALLTPHFEVLNMNDWSDDALRWRKRQSEKEAANADSAKTPPVSPALILGPEFAQMGSNVMKNLAGNAARVIELCAQRRVLD